MKLKVILNIQNKTGFALNNRKIQLLIESELKKRNYSGRWEIGIFLVKRDTIKSINKKYRDLNQVTDVLSFAINEQKIPGVNKEILPLNYLGDIFVCLPYIADVIKDHQKEKWPDLANYQKKRLINQELEFILRHGLLHLFGIHHK